MSTRGAEDDQPNESQLSVLLECCICFQGLRKCLICVECSQPFCQECIDRWLRKESTCPYCRAHVQKDRLVRFYLMDQLHETIERMLAEQNRNRCEMHGSQQLLLVCLRCEQCVCVDCWYSDEHVEHKDEVVPMEIAYSHYYRETMKPDQSAQLKDDKKGVQDKIKILYEEKQDAHTMNQILELWKTLEKLQIDEKDSATS